jgi:HSP20 family protein
MDLWRQMESEMQRIAEEAMRGFFGDPIAQNRFWHPRADVHETADSVLVKMEIVGVRPDQLNVELSSDNRVLKVSGVRSEDDEERAQRIRCYQLEIYFGPFEREILLPHHVRIDRDAIVASYRDGFLLVTLPKSQQEEPPERAIVVT